MKFNIVESLETAPSSDNNTSKKEIFLLKAQLTTVKFLGKTFRLNTATKN